MFSTGYRPAGFLAYLSADVESSAVTYVPFDTEVYDYGNNYNQTTGVYRTPCDGLYLIHARLRGFDNTASHYIMVNGNSSSRKCSYGHF